MIELPNIPHFSPLDFSHLIESLNKNIQTLKTGGGMQRPKEYEEHIRFFEREYLASDFEYNFSDIELRSSSMHLIENKTTFERLINNKKRFKDYSAQLVSSDSIVNQKKAVSLFFQYFQLINKKNSEFIHSITMMLQSYQGNQSLLKEYKTKLDYVLHPERLLSHMKPSEAANTLLISPSSEYYQTLIVLNLTKELNKLTLNEENQTLFSQLINHRDFLYNNELHIAEYTARSLIVKMMVNETQSFDKWVNFIIDIIGDPRTVGASASHTLPWSRVGEQYKSYLIRYLSREDLNLFLDVLGDNDRDIDKIYEYRKKFWKHFAPHVRFTKLFVTDKKYRNLPDDIRKRFKGNNTAYSFISDSSRSCIYLDLGNIKVIEGTHNARVRIYSDVPIDLSKKHFDYTDFYRPAMSRSVITDEISHTYSEAGGWQNNVLDVLKRNMDININLSDTY